jgi:hypothetical protein
MLSGDDIKRQQMDDTLDTACDCGREGESSGKPETKRETRERETRERDVERERRERERREKRDERETEQERKEREKREQREAENKREEREERERYLRESDGQVTFERERQREFARERDRQRGLNNPQDVAREQREDREYAVAESESLFGDLKRAAGVDTNKFVVNVVYRTFSGRDVESKHATIKQEDSFKTMLQQPFFADLINKGPLTIESLDILAEKPERTYHVHKKLMKTLETVSHDLSDKDLSTSIVQNLSIKLKFDDKKNNDEEEFKAAIVKVAALFNIKFVACTYNGRDTPLFSTERRATPIDWRILGQAFRTRNDHFDRVNAGTQGYIAAFGSNSPDETSIVVYRPFNGKQPAHFTNATIESHDETRKQYNVRFEDNQSTGRLDEEFVVKVGAGDFTDYQRILVPAHKAVVNAAGIIQQASTNDYDDADAQARGDDDYADGGYHQGTRSYNNGGAVGTSSTIYHEGTSKPAVTTSTVTDNNSMTTTSRAYDQSGRTTAYTSNTSSCTLL